MPDNDEPLFSSVALNLLRQGDFGIPVFGDINGSSHDFIYVGKAYALALALWFKFSGVTLFTGRLFPLAGGILTAAIVYQIGRRLSEPKVGLLASALTLFAWKIFLASHRARPDIWIALAGVLIFWIYIEQSAPNWLLGFLSGLCINIHLPAGFFVIAISVIQIFELLSGKTSRNRFLEYGVGLTLGIGVWLAATFLPDPSRTLAQYAGGLPGTKKDELNYLSWSLTSRYNALLSVWLTGFLNANRLGWLEITTLISSGLLLSLSRIPVYNRLLLFTISAFASIVLSPYFQLYYLVMFIPFFSLIVAGAADRLSKTIRNKIAFLIAIPLLLGYVAGDLAFTWNSRIISHSRYAEAVKHYIPPHSSILADGGLWFDLTTDHTFTIDNYVLYSPQAQSMPIAAWLKYVFISRKIDVVLKNERMGNWYIEVRSPQEQELLIALSDLLTNNCQQLGVVTDLFYGVDRGGPAPKRTEVWQCPALQP